MTPHSISRPMAGAPFPVSITPYPVTDVPGSTPKTLTSPRHRRHRLGVNVEVGVDPRDVVHLFQSLDQLEEARGLLPLDLDTALRDQRNLGALDRDPLGLERVLDGVEPGDQRRNEECVPVA